VALVCAAGSVGVGATAARAAAPILQTAYNPHERTTPIAQSFLGVSTDWPLVYERIQGIAPGPDPLYDQLIANLAAYGGGVPTLRIGGGYQDHAWWDPGAAPRPADLGIQFNIYPGLLNALAASTNATSQRLILGINMAANNVGLATDEVRAMQQTLPSGSVLSYDIGNEPDGYGQRGLYTAIVGGQPVVHTMRSPRTWGVGPYTRQFEKFAASIERISPRPPLSATSGYGTLITTKPFLRRAHRQLVQYTQHSYVGTACNPSGVPYPPSSPRAPTIPRLLSDPVEFATLGANLAGVAETRRYHLPLRLTEWQSYACGGKDGVSNTFAASLWALDSLMLDAALGVTGVNVHLDSYGYAPFLTYDANGGRAATVEALYYSMLLFAQATGHHARVLPSVVAKERPARGVNVRVWGTREATGTLHFVVVDKDLRHSGRVVIRVPNAHGAATLIRLTAPSVSSHFGITLAGQTFAQPTTDGLLTGQPVHEVVAAHGGTYTFTIAKTSAAMLTVSASSY
jgi:hypothetical protein